MLAISEDLLHAATVATAPRRGGFGAIARRLEATRRSGGERGLFGWAVLEDVLAVT